MAWVKAGSQCMKDASRAIIKEPFPTAPHRHTDRSRHRRTLTLRCSGHRSHDRQYGAGHQRQHPPIWRFALAPTVLEAWKHVRAMRGQCCRIRSKAPVSRQGHVLLMRSSFREQGTEDRGFEVRTWRTYLGAWRKTPNPLCFGATAYESRALPLSYLAAGKTIPHSKGRATDVTLSRHRDQEPWDPLLCTCSLSSCGEALPTRRGSDIAYGAEKYLWSRRQGAFRRSEQGLAKPLLTISMRGPASCPLGDSSGDASGTTEAGQNAGAHRPVDSEG
jgi:hypothetical protein